MKTMVLAVVALAATLASASSIDLETTGGMLTATATTLSVLNSALTKDGATLDSDLGLANLTTGALSSGTLAGGGMFAAGGTFTITGDGEHGVPNGVIFQGTLSTLTWTLHNLSGGLHDYTLQGDFTSPEGNGTFILLTDATAMGLPGKVGSVDITLVKATVPEPATLSLVGLGLTSLVGLKRLVKQ